MSTPKKKRVQKPESAFLTQKKGMNAFSEKGVKKPIRATYYGKKAR